VVAVRSVARCTVRAMKVRPIEQEKACEVGS